MPSTAQQERGRLARVFRESRAQRVQEIRACSSCKSPRWANPGDNFKASPLGEVCPRMDRSVRSIRVPLELAAGWADQDPKQPADRAAWLQAAVGMDRGMAFPAALRTDHPIRETLRATRAPWPLHPLEILPRNRLLPGRMATVEPARMAGLAIRRRRRLIPVEAAIPPRRPMQPADQLRDHFPLPAAATRTVDPVWLRR